jgi:hypothetical protein
MVKICFAPQLATIYYPEKNTRRINEFSPEYLLIITKRLLLQSEKNRIVQARISGNPMESRLPV